MRWFLPAVFMVCAVISWPDATAMAAEQNLHVGVDVGEVYDSNVFVAPVNREEDYITELRPWLLWKRPFGDASMFTVNCKLTGKLYAKNSDSNTVDQDLGAKLDFRGARFYIKLEDRFQYSSYPISSTVAQKVDNWVNDFNAGVGADYYRVGWEVGLTSTVRQYIRLGSYDYTEIAPYVEGNYKVGEATRVYLRATFGMVNYLDPVHNDTDYIDVKLGIRGNIGEKTSFDAGIGYQQRNYDDGGSLIDSEDYASISASCTLSYAFSSKTGFSLTLKYGPQESVNSNYNKVLFAGVSANHFFTEKISAIGTITYEDAQNSASAANDYHKITCAVAAKYEVTSWMALTLELSYESRGAATPTTEYERFTAGVFAVLRY
ncbi:MAG: outer membrane beta-barrel protein [Candidatus Brocadiia bacterium]